MKNFIERWLNRGDEKSDTQIFWLEFLEKICGVKNPGEIIEFEKRVSLEDKNKGFIDAYIPATRVIIEQKSINIQLDSLAYASILTPFEQAKRYSDWLPDSERARWIITCNFQEFQIHDMERPKAEPEIIRLENLEREWRKFLFLIDTKAASPKEIHEEEISIKAGELVGRLYDSLIERYVNPNDKESQRSLNIFCVRVVFLLYAEDSGLFEKSQFHDYLKSRELVARDSLRKLFDVLNQKIHERDPYLEADSKNFPFVNGGLFSEKNIELPQLDGEPLRIILEEMSEGFDWSKISPTIFGAVFESTLNPETRHSGGMHYTTVGNIHKVIDPLFLDELEKEFKKIRSKEKLRKFREKLASLKFLDPACGSGNFLTESYLSLCRLEMKVIEAIGEIPILSVNIEQFYGIEINDFAVAVAKTALWISSLQMAKECNPEIDLMEQCLPLDKFDKNIIEGNALTLDWRDVIAPNELNFIMGNPPFIGYSNQNDEQKKEILAIYVDEKGKPYKSSGKIDYVAGWFFKAAEFIQGTKIPVAFVATNSITQGEQVAAIFKPLYERWGIEIDFAHQSFVWDSELKDNLAHVHCVVIGFSTDKPPRLKKLFTPEGLKLVENINFYLKDAPNFFIKARKTPICDVPMMRRGSQATDGSKTTPEMKAGGKPTEGGNLILTPEEKDELLKKNPLAKKFIRPFMMGVDFIQRKPRYCLWLVDVKPDDIKKCPLVMKRIKAVKAFRLASKKKATQRKAETPSLFDERVEITKNYVALPKVSSGTRDYIPIDWLDASIIPGDKLFIVQDATRYHFGILTSRIHMAWMRYVGGRFGMGYSYSNTVVYNNFVWPSVNAKQRAKIESTTQKILDVRAKFPGNSFASLYDPLTMPAELLKAHRENDAAVCAAYGWNKNISEEEIVSELMRMYEKMTE